MLKNILVSNDYFEDAIESLRHYPTLGLDTETYGLGRDDRLFSIQIYDGLVGYYFNFHDYGEEYAPYILDRKKLERFHEIFYAPSRLYQMTNAAFDMQKLALEGLEIRGVIHDTVHIGRLIQNNMSSHSLAAWAEVIGEKKDDSVEKYIEEHKLTEKRIIGGKKKTHKFFDKVPFDIMVRYGAHDAYLSSRIASYQGSEVMKRATAINLCNQECALTKIFFNMSQTGIKINIDYVKEALEYEQKIVDDQIKEFERSGFQYINSGKNFSKLFDSLGVTYPYTEKGNPCFDKQALKKIDHPLARLIESIRFYEKRISTYFKAFLNLHEDSVIHANLNQSGARTGRPSVSNPNLLNLSKKSEENLEEADSPYSIRGCFVPRDRFHFVSIDYDQEEFRLLLDYAGESEAIERVLNGEDVHQVTSDMMNVSRTMAKTLNFALLYGVGVGKLSEMLGVEKFQARNLKDKYFARFNKIGTFISEVQSRALRRGWIFNSFGRRYYLNDPSEAYKLTNYLIQGTAADVIKSAMVEIDELLVDYQSRMLLNIYDELLFEIHENEWFLVPIIKRIMEKAYIPKKGMRLTCGAEWSSDSWAPKDMKKLEEVEHV